jgi:hypothetical protein
MYSDLLRFELDDRTSAQGSTNLPAPVHQRSAKNLWSAAALPPPLPPRQKSPLRSLVRQEVLASVAASFSWAICRCFCRTPLRFALRFQLSSRRRAFARRGTSLRFPDAATTPHSSTKFSVTSSRSPCPLCQIFGDARPHVSPPRTAAPGKLPYSLPLLPLNYKIPSQHPQHSGATTKCASLKPS